MLQAWPAAGRASFKRLSFGVWIFSRWLILKALLQGRQFRFPVSDRQYSVIPDFVKTRRQAVLQEAADEFRGIERQGFLLAVVAVVFVRKRNIAVLNSQDSPVADSDAMGITPQIVDHLFRPAEGAFGIHHPLFFVQRGEQLFERFFMLQSRGLSAELQLTLLIQVPQVMQEFSAEQAGKHAYRQKTIVAASHPGGFVVRQPTTGHNAVQVRVQRQVLSPGVQYGDHAGLSSEPLGLPGQLAKCFPGGAEQQVIQLRLIVHHHGVQAIGQSKNQMEISYRQEFLRAVFNPALLSRPLAFGTVPVATGIVRHYPVAAGRAGVHMAAQCRRATVHDSLCRFVLLKGQVMCVQVVGQMTAQDIRDLKRCPAHLLALGQRPINRALVWWERSNADSGPW